ncbi:hypothetical protein CAPI_00220 [Corynebacterium capitovis DSM 44611]|nr:hypothetical protein CAPI_00220 [Corynebacterium capitovis DSM 44611]
MSSFVDALQEIINSVFSALLAAPNGLLDALQALSSKVAQ